MAVILVVDDERPIVELITDLVIEHGHTAVTASNGVEALQQARSHHPALIISDVMMPVMGGYALLEALRTNPALTNTAVYLTSAVSFRDPPPVDPGPDGYIPKPFDFAIIEGLLASIAGAEQLV
jgi:CheY-like chemotaxis protein